MAIRQRAVRGWGALPMGVVVSLVLFSKAEGAPAPALPRAVAVLIDETSRELYVIPPDASKVLVASGGASGFVVKPGLPFTHPLVSNDKINSLETPLAERLGLFVYAAQKKLPRVQFDVGWGQTFIRYIYNSHRFAAGTEVRDTLWPLAVPYAMSTLPTENGFVLVFTVKSADKMGTLQKIDLARFWEGGTVRSYWSRSFNDPTQTDSSVTAIDKAMAHFSRSLQNKKPQAVQEGKLRLVVDRKLSERDVVVIEKAIRALVGLDVDAVLVPYEVSRNDIRYQTPLPVTQLAKLQEKLAEVGPGLAVVVTSAGSNVATIKQIVK